MVPNILPSCLATTGVKGAQAPALNKAIAIRPRAVQRRAAVVAQASSKHGKVKKVVLAYSGGLDTSIILKWLQDEYGCEVVTFTADLGQVGVCAGPLGSQSRGCVAASRGKCWNASRPVIAALSHCRACST